MKKRSWSKGEKLAILSEAKKEGVQLTIRKHKLYPATFYSWRRKYAVDGEDGLSDTASKRKDKQRIAALEDQVSLLKELLAERDMEIALQDELLKKKYPRARKKS